MPAAPYIEFAYPITKPFRSKWRYIDWVLLAFGGSLLALLIAFNVYFVGYDVISVMTTDFNRTQDLPWYQRWKETGNACQEHTFYLGDNFRTNMSTFSYEIFGLSVESGNAHDSQSGISYSNSVLDGCNVAYFQFTTRVADRTVTLDVQVDCPAPMNFQARTTWSYTNHKVIGALDASFFAANSTPRAIIEALNYFGEINYHAIWNNDYTYNGDQLEKFIVTGQPDCNGDTSCRQVRPDVGVTFFNGIRHSDMGIVFDTNSSTSDLGFNIDAVYDLTQVYLAAIQLDIGHYMDDNLFINGTAFSTSLHPSYLTGTDAFITAASENGAAYVNGTLSGDGSASHSTIIRIPYVCNMAQRKTAGTFFFSVASATLSLFLSVWGLVLLGLGTWARASSREANSCCIEQPISLRRKGTSDEELLNSRAVYSRRSSSYKGIPVSPPVIHHELEA
ncbi:hypothetical protein BD626DRAFT_487339 [Schizophyllum amplum]|uniref:Uncharacterized protein n=1 Tax=Schizophyllum amplum TaxID=97359 RepID=A0A550CNC0_9AGAR|nr:hypothetical protein BD626DRAFT_487339 [Auriculariopsis ampla]